MFGSKQCMKKISRIKKSLLINGKNSVQATQWLNKCNSDFAPSTTSVNRWYEIKRGGTETNDAERSGRPNSAAINIQKSIKLLDV